MPNRFLRKTASLPTTSSPTRALRASLVLCAAALALPGAAFAQDEEAQPSLEELIPDSAVANPEAWAAEGAEPDAAEPDALTEDIAELPISDMPEMAVDWPEDIEVPAIEPLAPEEDIEFVDLDLGRPRTASVEIEEQQLSDSLVIGFPQTEPPFAQREDFIARFEALSTIEELDAEGEENVAQLASRARADERLLGNLLRVYGYYDGQVIRSIGSRDAAQDAAEAPPVVHFDVIPGPRYRFGATGLGQLGTAPDAEALRAAFEIVTGDYLSSDKIVEEQFDLDRALGETGYPFAAIDAPELLIDHARQEGDLTLPVRPGGKYAFGEVISSDPEFLSSRHLARIARFDPGDIYQRSLELDLRRAITATGLVSSVTITPREVAPPQGDQPGVVAMDIGIERAPVRTIAGAIGYGSEEGFRVQASWEHRNFFPPEGALRVRGIIGTREQLAGVTFRKNNFTGRDKVLTLDAYVSSLDTDAYDADTVALTGTFERLSTLLFQKPFSWALGAEILATDERNRMVDGVPRPRQAYFIGSIFGRATIDTSDSLLDPTKGFRVTGYVAPEVSHTQGSTYAYLRTQGDASYYQPFGDSVVGAARVRVASIPGAPLFAIAPSRRLYAGGGGSVRGYGYEAIGPRNEFGEPTGGRSLVEVSAEARIGTGFFDGALSVVPFIDAGAVSVSQIPDFKFIKIGAGIGVRYDTGFGPIRVDVGVPLNPEEDDAPVAVYVSLGQAF